MDAPRGDSAVADSGLECLLLMLRYLRLSPDAAQILHERGKGGARFTAEDMLRAAKALGARARRSDVPAEKLPTLPTPCVLELADGGFAILGKATDLPGEGPRALIQSPLAADPELLDADAIAARYAGRAILMTTREELAGARRRFDVGWFIPVLVKYRAALRDVLVASLVIQLVGLATPLFFQLVVDKVLVHHALATLQVLMAGLLLASLWEVVLTGLRTWLFAHTTNRVDAELGAQLFRHLLSLPLGYFEARRVGDSVARVRELENIREFLTSNSITLVIDLLFTVVFLAVMLVYSVPLTLVVVGSLVLYAAVSIAFTAPLRRALDEKFDRGAENQAFLVEAVTAIGTLKAMAVEPILRERWERRLAGYIATGFRVTRIANWGGGLISAISKVSGVLILFLGALAVIDGKLTVGGLVAFNMLAARVAAPVLRLAQLWQDFQRTRVSIERLGDILNTHAEPSPTAGHAALARIEGRVAFEHVGFRYRVDLPLVLRDVSLEVAAGEVLGIVGPSGSGKSTLTKLIQRLYVPDQGKVLVDGQDVALMPPDWLRRQIGVVLQENVLLNMSVRDNIALADPTMDMRAINAAAEMAGAHDFIARLPQGYDTRIEERGANLSGGQRQRIAIARAIVGDPRILILDEATSALDAESEEIIQRNLRLLARGRTVIIIAHRLSAVRQADRIITLEDGAITEEGRHDQLLQQGGTYARLHAKQMGIG